MKSLILLRHAKSSWSEEGQDDYERPLNARGKRDAPSAGQILAREGLPDFIVSSSARRANATARRVIQASGYRADLLLTPRLYLAPPSAYFALMQSLCWEPPSLLMVGHNPGIEELVRILTGKPVPMPTAALVRLELPILAWKDASFDTQGSLQKYWTPE